MSKKIISLLLSLLMLVSVLSVSAFAMEAETLEKDPYSGTMTVSASAASVQVGDTFKVTVGITAADVVALKLEFKYDETVFEFVSGEFCESTPNKDYEGNKFSSSACAWANYLGLGVFPGADLSGDFATLTFKALKEADSASITISAQGGTTWLDGTWREQYINFDDASASVKITAAGGTDPVDPVYGLLGDANGDGEVDTADATLILKYNALEDVTLDLRVCDCNGDGAVDTADATLILKYNALEDVANVGEQVLITSVDSEGIGSWKLAA